MFRIASFMSWKARLVLFYLILIAVTCSPIWGVKYFVNQDGAAHVYSAAVMLELAANNTSVAEVYALNSIAVPNSSGHWLLAFLLLFLNPFLVTKLIVTFTFAGFVAAVGWLRWSTNGGDGLKTGLLLGAALGFNWMWLLGFYNFLIGVIIFAFVLGLFSALRNEMNWRRAAVLSGLFLLAYFSHLISFGVLAGAVFLFCIFTPASNRSRSVGWVFAAILPVLPFALLYKLSTEGGDSFDPVWVVMTDPGSFSNWVMHLRTLDPFVIISRRALPFAADTSGFYAIASPVLLITLACSLLAIASLWSKENRKGIFRENLQYVIAMLGVILLAVISPDEFRSQGSFLRPRLMLCGLVLFVPLFRTGTSIFFKRLAQFALIVVIAFQTAALWEYAIKTDKEATEFLSVGNALKNGDTVGSIVILNAPSRFYAEPTTQMSNFIGIGKNVLVYDNYEIGHTLFPVVARNAADREFVREFTDAKVIRIPDVNENIDEKLLSLSSCLEHNNYKMNTMLVWGRDLRVEAVLQKWYESEPFFENGRVRAYRNKYGRNPAKFQAKAATY